MALKFLTSWLTASFTTTMMLFDLIYYHVLPGNVTNYSWNHWVSFWPFFGRSTTIHFTNLLHINKSLICGSRCNFWTILSPGLSLLLDWSWTLLNSVLNWTGANCSFSFVTSRRTEYRSPSRTVHMILLLFVATGTVQKLDTCLYELFWSHRPRKSPPAVVP
jgi:hypothetical protein